MTTTAAAVSSTATRSAVTRQTGNAYYQALLGQLEGLGFGTRLPKLLGLASCAPRAGVSTIASNLALEVARGGLEKVLLIDANHNNPSLHRLFSRSAEPGLLQAMAGDPTVDQCICETEHESLHLLPAGVGSAAIPSGFRAARFEKVMEEIREQYDFIVVDLPPANKMSNSFVMASFLDGLVLVVEAERNEVEALQLAKRQFIQANANLLGVVLNKSRQATG